MTTLGESRLFIPVDGGREAQAIEVNLDQLPPVDTLTVVLSNEAPLDLWWHIAVEYYKRGELTKFARLFEEPLSAEGLDYFSGPQHRDALARVYASLAALRQDLAQEIPVTDLIHTPLSQKIPQSVVINTLKTLPTVPQDDILSEVAASLHLQPTSSALRSALQSDVGKLHASAASASLRRPEVWLGRAVQALAQDAISAANEQTAAAEVEVAANNIITEAKNTTQGENQQPLTEEQMAALQANAEQEAAKLRLGAKLRPVSQALGLIDTLVSNATRAKSDDPLALLVTGCLRFHQRRYKDALQALSRALVENPQLPAAVRVAIAHCYIQLGDEPKAKAALERALEVDPDCVPALIALCALERAIYLRDAEAKRVQRATERHTKAQAARQDLVRKADAQDTAASAENKMDDASTSTSPDHENKPSINKAILDPTDPRPRAQTSISEDQEVAELLDRDFFSESYPEFDIVSSEVPKWVSLAARVVELKTHHPQQILLLANLAFHSGDLEASRQLTEHAAVLASGHVAAAPAFAAARAEVSYQRGRLFHVLGQYTAAEEQYAQALLLAPTGHVQASYGRAQVLFAQGKFKEALLCAEVAHKAAPTNCQIMRFLAAIHARLVLDSPTNYQSRESREFTAQDLVESEAHSKKARALFERVLSIQPDDLPTQLELALLCAKSHPTISRKYFDSAFSRARAIFDRLVYLKSLTDDSGTARFVKAMASRSARTANRILFSRELWHNYGVVCHSVGDALAAARGYLRAAVLEVMNASSSKPNGEARLLANLENPPLTFEDEHDFAGFKSELNKIVAESNEANADAMASTPSTQITPSQVTRAILRSVMNTIAKTYAKDSMNPELGFKVPPATVTTFYNLGLLCESQSLFTTANELYSAILASYPDYVDARVRSIEIQYKLTQNPTTQQEINEQIAKASQALREVLESLPKDSNRRPDIMTQLASTLLASSVAETSREAEVMVKQTYETYPKDVYAWTFRGQIMADHASHERVRYMRYADQIALSPGSKNLPEWQKAASQHKKNAKVLYTEAYAKFRRASILDPSNVAALTGLGICAVELAQLSEDPAKLRAAVSAAREAFTQARFARQGLNEVAPYEPLINLAHVNVMEDMFDEAIKLYRQALDLAPPAGQPFLKTCLARALHMASRSKEAKTVLESLLEQQPGDETVRYNLAIVREEFALNALQQSKRRTFQVEEAEEARLALEQAVQEFKALDDEVQRDIAAGGEAAARVNPRRKTIAARARKHHEYTKEYIGIAEKLCENARRYSQHLEAKYAEILEARRQEEERRRIEEENRRREQELLYQLEQEKAREYLERAKQRSAALPTEKEQATATRKGKSGKGQRRRDSELDADSEFEREADGNLMEEDLAAAPSKPRKRSTMTSKRTDGMDLTELPDESDEEASIGSDLTDEEEEEFQDVESDEERESKRDDRVKRKDKEKREKKDKKDKKDKKEKREKKAKKDKKEKKEKREPKSEPLFEDDDEGDLKSMSETAELGSRRRRTVMEDEEEETSATAPTTEGEPKQEQPEGEKTEVVLKRRRMLTDDDEEEQA